MTKMLDTVPGGRPFLEDLVALYRSRFWGHRIRAVYLFGSRARGDHRPDSDVDLAVFVDPRSGERPRRAYNPRREGPWDGVDLWAESNDAIEATMDLVDPSDPDLPEFTAILWPTLGSTFRLQNNIARQGIPIWHDWCLMPPPRPRPRAKVTKTPEEVQELLDRASEPAIREAEATHQRSIERLRKGWEERFRDAFGVGSDPTLQELDAQRAADWQCRAIERAQAVVVMLKARGVEARVVGSLARGDFRVDSDVDFLILSLGRPEDRYAVEGDVALLMGGLPFDVIYLNEVRSEHSRRKLLEEADRGRHLV